MNIYLQKYQGTTCEFLGYDLVEDKADPKLFLGDIGIIDGMSKKDLITKLRIAADKLEKHKGDVFVIQ